MLPIFLFKQYLGWHFRSSETCFRSRRSAAVAPAAQRPAPCLDLLKLTFLKPVQNLDMHRNPKANAVAIISIARRPYDDPSQPS
ncbi:hypothetical protein [Lysobacter antibioticus]|uniref:hypothetical protein n=1 Tax=Lysobacter antibioticus TaxID=84531 RepID=UPI0009EABB4F|nr:hypothetical protein [Lysobacter antibioticus]